MKKRSVFFQIPVLLALSSPLIAQQPTADTLKVNDLAPVTVTAYRLEMTDLATPLSMTSIGQRQLQTGTQQLALDEALMAVPGVFVQNGSNFAQDIRVSIRGFGARSQFGIRGVKILVDGFPESTPDGTAQVDAIDPGSLTGLTVIRSGTGGLYGNASGGSINFSTMKFNDEEWGETSQTIGSYGFQKSQIKLGGGKANKFLYSANTAFSSLDGYREHSANKNFLVNTGFLIPVDSTMTIRGVMTYVNSPYAQDPGGLSTEDIEEDGRRKSNYDFSYYDTGENLWQLRMGVSIAKAFSKSHRVNASFFQTNRKFESYLIEDAIKLHRSFTGGTVNYEYKTKPRRFNWNLNLDLDFELQNDDRKRFDNGGGEFGDEYANLTESFSSAGFFAIQKLELNEQIILLSSLRYDRIFINVDDKFPGNNNADDLQDDFHALNPTLGISILSTPNSNIFLNFGSNFETPTLLELAQAEDKNLKPQRSQSYELGYKFYIAEKKLRIEPTIFLINLKDEIVRTTDNTGNNAFRNVGSSTRRGIEFALAGQFSKHLNCSFNFNFYDFVFEDYGDFDGNKMPGIPRLMSGAMATYTGIEKLVLILGTNWVGKVYTNFNNSDATAPYFYGFVRASYSFKLKSNDFEWSGGINNLFNDAYNANIRINSGSPYEPAPLINFYTGLKFRF